MSWIVLHKFLGKAPHLHYHDHKADHCSANERIQMITSGISPRSDCCKVWCGIVTLGRRTLVISHADYNIWKP